MSPVHPAVARRLFFRHRYRVTAVAAALAANAGFVNGVALGLTDHPVSHHTGSIARLGQDLVFRRAPDLALVLSLVAAFFVGAMTAGGIVGTRRLLPGRRYGAVLLVEGVCLALSAALFAADRRVALLLAAAACGLQNGMANNFYGVVVRTTHLSGLITDLGVLTGHWLTRRPVEGWRALFQGSIVAGFVAGAVGGAFAARYGGPSALAGPALLCTAGGVGYLAWMSRQRRRVSAASAPPRSPPPRAAP
jgi:uncharacterized membrane protein YoaK (UPF0700 family)